jgi:adenine deaminase
MSILTRIYAHAELALPVLVKHGEALHHELELLIGAGLSTVDALRVVTSLPVKYFNLNDRSVIEIRKRVDLVPICKIYSRHSSDKFNPKDLVW